MKKKIAVVLALVALAGFAAASALTVKQRQDTASLHAERFTIGDLFLIEASTLTPVLSTQGAAGVLGSPVEMTSPLASARTSLVQDHWMYTVEVKEANSASVTGGDYIIELQLDGSPVSSLYVSQGTAQAASIEGVRASFDLGTTLGSSSLYYVVVRPYVPDGPTVDIVLASNANDNLTWVGVGEPVDGVINPDIPLALGSTLRLTARNNDDQLHNIGFLSGGAVIEPPGWSNNFDADGEEETIAWRPSAAGTYTYRCQYHPSMEGDIVVA